MIALLALMLAMVGDTAATATDDDNSPEAIAQDAARDLTAGSVYNKPGATRADYDADWQQCRLIARGGAVGGVMMSGVAAAALDYAIAEGRQRRANRKSCLLMKGWRFVSLPDGEAARVRAMSDADKASYFNTVVGAADLVGKRTLAWNTEYSAPTLAPADAAPIDTGKPPTSNLTAALAPGTDEGILMVGFRRRNVGSQGRSGRVVFARYDMASHDILRSPDKVRVGLSPPGARRTIDDRTACPVDMHSQDKSSQQEYIFAIAKAGDYVLSGAAPGSAVPIPGAFCFGAPVFHVSPGEVTYVGDFTPYAGRRATEGGRTWAMAYSSHVDEAEAFVKNRPDLPRAFRAAVVQNNATYGCRASGMTAYIIPGLPSLPSAGP